MPVDVTYVGMQIVIVDYHGLVKYEELHQAYIEILVHHRQQQILYFVGFGIEMMYDADELFDENLRAMTNEIIFAEGFRAVIFISLPNHALAKQTIQHYEKMGIPEKLHFVKDYDAALALIEELDKR